MSAHFARISSKYFHNCESRRIAIAEWHSDRLQSRRRDNLPRQSKPGMPLA